MSRLPQAGAQHTVLTASPHALDTDLAAADRLLAETGHPLRDRSSRHSTVGPGGTSGRWRKASRDRLDQVGLDASRSEPSLPRRIMLIDLLNQFPELTEIEMGLSVRFSGFVLLGLEPDVRLLRPKPGHSLGQNITTAEIDKAGMPERSPQQPRGPHQ